MPVIIVAPLRWSRSPLQTFFLILLAITGLLIVFNLSRNGVTDDMGEPWASLWGGSLTLGSATAVIGSYWPDKITGMLVERSGIWLLGGASLIWPVLIIVIIGFLRSPLTVIFTLFFSAACFLQVRYINKHFNLIMEAIKERPKDG